MSDPMATGLSKTLESLGFAPTGPLTAPASGLAMVAELVTLLGGTVTSDFPSGTGRTFTLRLPFRVHAAGSGESPDAENEAEPAGRRTVATVPRLLVVAGPESPAQILADTLAGTYLVEVVVDVQAAEEAIRHRLPDLVLADPDLSGPGRSDWLAALRAEPELHDLPVLLLSSQPEPDAVVGAIGLDDADDLTGSFTLLQLRARLAARLSRARERSMDDVWRQAALTAIQDGLVIADQVGRVIELNPAFTELLGYDLEVDGPMVAPYPWWPTEEEDADSLAEISALHAAPAEGPDGRPREVRLYRKDRSPVWVWWARAQVSHRGSGVTATVHTVRDISREKAARERRVAAVQVSVDFATSDDLDTVLSVAEHGFALLFDGGCTVQLDLDDRTGVLLSGGNVIAVEDLAEEVRVGLAGEPNPDTVSRRPGILLVPNSSLSGCRAWIQVPRPRRIGADEMIVADLLAQAFALAVDRVLEAQQAADREANLQQALESHRVIGQAIGILVERHRILPRTAFERLRTGSQNRNIKLRELARRVIESGQEPDRA